MEGLPGEPSRVLVVRQQLRELVAEHRDAARLEPDDRDAVADLVAQRLQDPLEVAPGEPEEAVVVQRPSAAEAGRAEDGRRNPASARTSTAARPTSRLEVVRERVRPEEHLAGQPAAGGRASKRS